MAKQFIMLRNAAPSFVHVDEDPPSVPSSYSPVRRNTFVAGDARFLREAVTAARAGGGAAAALGALATASPAGASSFFVLESGWLILQPSR